MIIIIENMELSMSLSVRTANAGRKERFQYDLVKKDNEG